TAPTVIGVHGEKGERGLQGEQGIPGIRGTDGRTQYTHIAYADNAVGGGFSQTNTNKPYIGMYVDFNAADSTNPTVYKWTKWKGEDGAQGVPGVKGADGRTPYFHRAWSNSADGRDGFSTTDSTNKRYLGTLTDFTEADSQDPARYKWTALFENVFGGNRNYFKNGRTQQINTGNRKMYDMRTFIVDDFWKNPDRLKPNYVHISFEISLSPALAKDTQAAVHFSATPWYSKKITLKAGVTTSQKFDFIINLSGASENYKTDNIFVRFGTNYGFPVNLTVTLKNAMLAIGTNFHDYVKAIEDVETDIASKADQSLTQEQLNALNEKSQILEAEMKAKASMEAFSELEKAYNAFVKLNADSQKKSESDLVEAGRRIDLLTTQFGGLAELKTFIDTYMKSTNEGLIIGKNDASSTIKVSSDRISMFSAGKEVMYISQGVINIDNGIFTASVQIGRFRTEQYYLKKDVNVIRYVGG
ncbi:TPA: antireceptor, partial [Streptococcus pneumoniae]